MLGCIKINSKVLNTIGGVVIAGVGAMLMKKASLKCTEIMQEHKKTMEVIENCGNDFEDYTEEDKNNDILLVNTQTVIALIRNYAIPVTTTVVGGCMIINGILSLMYNKI